MLRAPRSDVRCHLFLTDILIDVANLPRNSVVLDPCAGIGTVNIRATLQSHYGIGGELSPSLFWNKAPYFFDCNRQYRQLAQGDKLASNGRCQRGSDMAGWDATLLPLRDSFVDAVISDIPFGEILQANVHTDSRHLIILSHHLRRTLIAKVRSVYQPMNSRPSYRSLYFSVRGCWCQQESLYFFAVELMRCWPA